MLLFNLMEFLLRLNHGLTRMFSLLGHLSQVAEALVELSLLQQFIVVVHDGVEVVLLIEVFLGAATCLALVWQAVTQEAESLVAHEFCVEEARHFVAEGLRLNHGSVVILFEAVLLRHLLVGQAQLDFAKRLRKEPGEHKAAKGNKLEESACLGRNLGKALHHALRLFTFLIDGEDVHFENPSLLAAFKSQTANYILQFAEPNEGNELLGNARNPVIRRVFHFDLVDTEADLRHIHDLANLVLFQLYDVVVERRL